MPRKVKLILNPMADMGRAWKTANDLRPIAQEFKGELTWSGTVYPTHAIELARQAAEEGYDLVIAMGGDGIGPFERHQKVETLVEQFGKRMRGIQANRTQEREQFARKKPAHPPNVRRHPIGAFEKTDTLVGQLRDE